MLGPRVLLVERDPLPDHTRYLRPSRRLSVFRAEDKVGRLIGAATYPDVSSGSCLAIMTPELRYR